MSVRKQWLVCLVVCLMLTPATSSVCQANPNTGPPTNLHRRFVVKQVKRKASQGRPVRRNVGVWLSGGYERTVSNSRRSGFRSRGWRSRRW